MFIYATCTTLSNSKNILTDSYQTEPHKPFFNVPKAGNRMPDSNAPYGTYDVEPADLPEWQILAPFKIDRDNPFDMEKPFEAKHTGNENFMYEARGRATLPGGNNLEVKWKSQKAYHNFIDFHVDARPAIYTIRLQSGVLGYALTYVESAEEKEVLAHIGFDDDIVVRVNNDIAFKGSHKDEFKEDSFKVKLKKGKNRVLVKLSNYGNTTWKLWAFSFRIVK